MDLKERKIINNFASLYNTRKLPGFYGGFEPNFQDINKGGGFFGTMRPSADEINNFNKRNIDSNTAQSAIGKSSTGEEFGFGNKGKAGRSNMMGGNPVSQIVSDIDYDFIQHMMQSVLDTSPRDKLYFDDYYGKNGTTVRNYGGFQFKRYNDLDDRYERQKISDRKTNTVLETGMKESIKGAEYGSAGGPIGAVIGGLAGATWGGIKGAILGNEEEEARLKALNDAKVQQNAENIQGEQIARANKYSYDWYTKHPAYKGSYLGAYNGIEGDVDVEKMQTHHKHLAHTPYGIKNTKVNAMVSPGELIVSNDNKNEHFVTGDSTKIDEEPAYIPKGAKVVSDNPNMPFPGTNMTFVQVYPFAKAAGLLDPFFATQKQERNNMNYKNGLHAADFGWENVMSTVPGMIETAFDYNKLKNEDIKLTNTRAVHPYSGVIQDLLNRRNVDIYPMLVDAARHEANTRYSINNSAHSNATKTLLNMVNSMNSRTARMKAFMDAERMRNDFAKESAAIYNDMGKSLMTSNLAAEQFNTQMNNQAHNAKVKMLSQKRADMQNLRSQFAKNAWEKKQFDWMMNYYNQDQEYKNAYLNWLRNSGYNNVSKSALKSASKKIDNNGLYGIRFTPDTLNARHDLYKKYQIDPFTRAAGKLNSKFKFENPFIFKS